MRSYILLAFAALAVAVPAPVAQYVEVVDGPRYGPEPIVIIEENDDDDWEGYGYGWRRPGGILGGILGTVADVVGNIFTADGTPVPAAAAPAPAAQ